MNSQTNIEGLLGKPLWQMTGEEYCQLTHYALSLSPNTGSSSPAPPGQKRKMVDDGLGLKRCELSSYPVRESCTLSKLNWLSLCSVPFPARRISAHR